MKIAILGGRFDPPHVGHLWVAQQTLECFPWLSEVYLLPCFSHAWRPVVARPEERLKMCQLIVKDNISVCAKEISRGGVSYSVETVAQLKKDSENEYFWIVGSDAISDFSRWREAAKLARLISFLVFPRLDYPIKILPPGFKKIEGPNLVLTNLSSTIIRERIKKGLSISGLVPKTVEEYIKEKGLYK